MSLPAFYFLILATIFKTIRNGFLPIQIVSSLKIDFQQCCWY